MGWRDKMTPVPSSLMDLKDKQEQVGKFNPTEVTSYNAQAPDAGQTLMLFSKELHVLGASVDTADAVKIVRQTSVGCFLCSIAMQGHADLTIISPFPVLAQPWLVRAYKMAPDSTTGHSQGSKLSAHSAICL